jgi:hypothetical protein
MPMILVCVFVCVCLWYICICKRVHTYVHGPRVCICVCVCVCVRTGRAVSRADLGLFYCKSCCLLLQKLVFFFETFAAARERALRVQFRVLIVCGCTCHHDNCVRLFFCCTHYYYLLYYDH